MKQWYRRFSALQRAEIAEIVLVQGIGSSANSFSALQRAEIAEIQRHQIHQLSLDPFQCSSTSRNC